MSIFEKDKSGVLVDMNDPEFSKIYEIISKTQALCFELNSNGIAKRGLESLGLKFCALFFKFISN